MQPLKLLLIFALLLVPSGCQKLDLFRLQNDDKEPEEKAATEKKEETEFIGRLAGIAGNTVVTIHGVGLVVGLDGTGEDPAPSPYRTALLEYMQKEGVPSPNEIIKSPNTALVQLTAYLTADIRKGDRFDVEVRLPPESDATSLAGGWLMETVLMEKAIVAGRGELNGDIYGRAMGPILISTAGAKNESMAGLLKRGKVLGGGVALHSRNLGLYLRDDFRSFRNSRRIADRIGQRFHDYEHGQKRPMAEAKTDRYVELKVHSKYKDNYPRYMQVVRAIAFRETPVQLRDRIEALAEKLANPPTAARAAIELEAIGTEGVPTLKKALSNPSAEVRFYAAEALAYLGEDAGAAELAAAARNERAFRVYALAALAALDEASSFEHLRELMNEPSAETRYGAFRALWTIDKDDPFIRGRRLNDQFNFHVLNTEGEPMIHLTRHRIAEVVLFGADQRFRTPLALTAGKHISINAPAGSETITVSRYRLGYKDERRVVSTRVADVILAVAELGATYPDVAEMLTQAELQYNAPGRIAIDALPQAGRTYYRPANELAGGASADRPARVGNKGMMPNLFPGVDDGEKDPGDEGPALEAPAVDEPADDFPTEPVPNDFDVTEVTPEVRQGEASLADIREGGNLSDVEFTDQSDEMEGPALKSADRESRFETGKRKFFDFFKGKAPDQSEPELD